MTYSVIMKCVKDDNDSDNRGFGSTLGESR